MKTWKKTFQTLSGFTLLELMTVVVIIGVLSSVAVPAFSRYMRKAKTSEVYTNLRKIYDGELVYFNEEHVDSEGKALTKNFIVTRIEPAWPPKVQKEKGDFSDGGWPWINFSADSPLQYCYFADAFPFPDPYPWFRPVEFNVTTDPPPSDVEIAFQVSAGGDIDGDKKFSRFERWAWRTFGNTDVEAIPAILSLDELE